MAKADPLELLIDLDDGLPAATATLGAKAQTAKAVGPRFAAPAQVAITSVPVAITASYAHIHCLQCGGDTRQFLGLFLESRLSNGVRVLARKTLRELGPFAALPRRLDVAPAEAVEICPECFAGDHTFREALAREQAQAELPWSQDDLTTQEGVKHERAKRVAAELIINLEEEESE